MIGPSDIRKVYEMSLGRGPIGGDEAIELELMTIMRPIRFQIPQLLTRSRRQKYCEWYLTTPGASLHPAIVELSTYKYLVEWMMSGMTKIEQDNLFR